MYKSNKGSNERKGDKRRLGRKSVVMENRKSNNCQE